MLFLCVPPSLPPSSLSSPYLVQSFRIGCTRRSEKPFSISTVQMQNSLGHRRSVKFQRTLSIRKFDRFSGKGGANFEQISTRPYERSDAIDFNCRAGDQSRARHVKSIQRIERAHIGLCKRLSQLYQIIADLHIALAMHVTIIHVIRCHPRPAIFV